MDTVYQSCRMSKLKLKSGSSLAGGSIGKKKKKSKLEKRNKKKMVKSEDSDSEQYGGEWWKIKDYETLLTIRNCAIEQNVGGEAGMSRRFWRALDNGKVVWGPMRLMGEGPAVEEQFTIIKTADTTKFGIKTGFNKYITVARDNSLQGISDAIGPRECFETVFEDGKCALSCGNNCFATIQESVSNSIYASALKVDKKEVVAIRTDLDRNRAPDPKEDDVDFGKLDVAEKSYVNKFQSFQNKKVLINSGDVSVLEKAREDGKLHEALLDRRSKMKHDKFC